MELLKQQQKEIEELKKLVNIGGTGHHEVWILTFSFFFFFTLLTPHSLLRYFVFENRRRGIGRLMRWLHGWSARDLMRCA